MKLAELKSRLAASRERVVRFRLPSGSLIPAHAHVTEVARIDKRFVDCGGMLHEECCCRLQTWVAKDFLHRLSAVTLLGILEKAGPILQTDDLNVDVEYEDGLISQYPVESIEDSDREITLRLAGRHTGCLAADRSRGVFRAIWKLLTG